MVIPILGMRALACSPLFPTGHGVWASSQGQLCLQAPLTLSGDYASEGMEETPDPKATFAPAPPPKFALKPVTGASWL